jgi:hypothetical protein
LCDTVERTFGMAHLPPPMVRMVCGLSLVWISNRPPRHVDYEQRVLGRAHFGHSEHENIIAVTLPASAPIFVRHCGTYIWYGTFTAADGSDGVWSITGVDLQSFPATPC